VTLEGSIGFMDGQPSLGAHVVLSREGDAGLETIAGEIVSARVVALEAIVLVADDVRWSREVDERTGVPLLSGVSDGAGFAAERAPRIGTAKEDRGADPAWSDAVAASADADREATRRSVYPSVSASVLPPKPVRPAASFDDAPFPEAGDRVEHFAFGSCEVLKSDGDRLHVKVAKDSRVKEIALEMLRVTPLGETPEGRRRFKLDRKM
jgi:hypothetical protein